MIVRSRSPILCLSALLGAGCSSSEIPNLDITPASASVGQWVQFYSIDFPDEKERLDYFYDAKQIHRTDDRLVARWKVVGSPNPTLTLYVVEIDCTTVTFTEKGTYVQGIGPSRALPEAERLANEKIEEGTSADKFRKMFCR